MGLLTSAARAAIKVKKAAAAAKRKAAARAAKIKRDANKGDLDVDKVVKAQVVKANKARSKREANEAAGKKAKTKTKAEDSGDISEVLMPEDRKPNDTLPETKRELERKAIGDISAKLTKPGLKPLDMSVYRSFTTFKRDNIKKQAGVALRAEKITQGTHDTIVSRIDAVNEAELMKNVRSMEQGVANKKSKPVSLAPDMDFSKGGTPAKPKSRTGHMDYRMGGLFK
tara:strand:+ start:54 stop:734 length:681 start_codon:yes stop_codon:yes gene_type:complete